MTDGTAHAVAGPADTGDSFRRRLRAAGTSMLAAAVTLALSAVSLALFFGNVAYIFGPINDVLMAIAMVLVVPAVLVVRDLAGHRAGAWFTALTWLALGGIALLVVGQVLLVTGVIGLMTSFATLGLGLVGLLAWAFGLAALALRHGVVAPAVGRWAIATGVTLALAAVGWSLLPLMAWSVLGAALLVAFVGWLVALGRDLRARAGQVG